MEKHTIINWSAVARESFERRINILDKIEEFTKESEFTDEDAIHLGKKVNMSLTQRLRNNKKSKK
ncbi:hypothetical protein COU57_05340 [Candidatus Pacearchaeota archaeon CG10_big_fil_rev_8_21_14_0_10_32_14]|nr:MAG: hypothetical protein COU57_05340 [Candidatus Pacearchaeota archaeon CG10_big_fil_rev_8_21_14_0_10_32_14]